MIDVQTIENIFNKCHAYGIKISAKDEVNLQSVVDADSLGYKTDLHKFCGVECIACLKNIFKSFIDYDGGIKKDIVFLMHFLAIATSSDSFGVGVLNDSRKEFEKIQIRYQKDMKNGKEKLSLIDRLVEDTCAIIDPIIKFLQAEDSEECLEMTAYFRTVKERIKKLSEVDGVYSPYIGNWLWQIKKEVVAINEDRGKWESVINKAYIDIKRQIINENLLAIENTVNQPFHVIHKNASGNKFYLKNYKEKEKAMKEQGIFKNNVTETAKALQMNVNLLNVGIQAGRESDKECLERMETIKARLEATIGTVVALKEKGDEYALSSYEILSGIMKTAGSIEQCIAKTEYLKIISDRLPALEGQIAKLKEETEKPQKAKRISGEYFLQAKESGYYKSTVGLSQKRMEYEEKKNSIRAQLDALGKGIHNPETDRIAVAVKAKQEEQEKILDEYDQGLISEDIANSLLSDIIAEREMYETALQERLNIESYVREAFGALRTTCFRAFSRIDAVLHTVSDQDFFQMADVANMTLENVRRLLVERNPDEAQIKMIRKTIDDLMLDMEVRMNVILGQNGVERIISGEWKPLRSPNKSANVTQSPKTSLVKVLLGERAEQQSGDRFGKNVTERIVGTGARRQEANLDDTDF